ncbi:MAG: hypothetical protein AB1813_18475 [Verrucomicrobiota bacterium]
MPRTRPVNSTGTASPIAPPCESKSRFVAPPEIWLSSAILVYCAWQARDLLSAWRHSPFDAFGWVIFLIWLIPAAAGAFAVTRTRFNLLMATAALVLSFVGELGSLNFLKYWGLASALAAWGRFSWAHCLWWISAAAWMPFFGWMTSAIFPEGMFVARFIVVVIGLGAFAIDHPWLGLELKGRPTSTEPGIQQSRFPSNAERSNGPNRDPLTRASANRFIRALQMHCSKSASPPKT